MGKSIPLKALAIHLSWIVGIIAFQLVIPSFAAIAKSSTGQTDLSGICDEAAQYASLRTGVPISVLKAISLNETGRRANGVMRPWPWTVNMEGKGVWFDTEDTARAYVYKHFKRGARSFDLGCFQINYKWHGKAFSSIEEMFDPHQNALYAARFLLELYREKGNWGAAAGAYHSRTEKYASRYRKRFERYRVAMAGEDAGPIRQRDDPGSGTVRKRTGMAPLPRINKYPLLKAGTQKGVMGSLMPLGNRKDISPIVRVAGIGGQS